jgi:hypothetical protein
MTVAGCTCPVPFTEDDYACRACESAEVEGLLASDTRMLAAQGLTWDDIRDPSREG